MTNKTSYIDTHIHLAELNPQDLQKALDNKHIDKFVCVSIIEKDWEKVSNLYKMYPEKIIPAFGIHPWYVKEAQSGWEKRLEKYLQAHPNALIGETGLDRLKDQDPEPQNSFFQAHIDLAKKYNRPLLIHAVKAQDWLENYWSNLPPKFVFHSFSGKKETLAKVVSHGGYVSFSGSILKAKHKEEVLKAVPLERVLLETDAPFQGNSEHIENLSIEIANIVDYDFAEVVSQIYKNTEKFVTIPSEDQRFKRTEALLGKDGMQKVKNSTVMIIGLGAVGGYALEGLARAGVGKLILVDFDVFDITNINRQILATTSTLGQKKVEIAKKRVLDINPKCNVITKDFFVNSDSLEELLDLKPDYVVDAIDSLNPKCQLIETLYNKEISSISSMGAALKSNPSFIRIGHLGATKNCGLAKFVRKRLKKRGVNINKVSCVSSDEQVELAETAIIKEENSTSHGRTRNTLGSLPTITAIFGLTIANEIIKRITSKDA